MFAPFSINHGRSYRTHIVCLVAGMLIGFMADDFFRSANAQIPDSGLQRNQMTSEMQRMNQTLSDVLGQLRTGTLKVRIVETDKQSSAKSASGKLNVAVPSAGKDGPVGRQNPR